MIITPKIGDKVIHGMTKEQGTISKVTVFCGREVVTITYEDKTEEYVNPYFTRISKIDITKGWLLELSFQQ